MSLPMVLSSSSFPSTPMKAASGMGEFGTERAGSIVDDDDDARGDIGDSIELCPAACNELFEDGTTRESCFLFFRRREARVDPAGGGRNVDVLTGDTTCVSLCQ